jgi:hypothetical protein
MQLKLLSLAAAVALAFAGAAQAQSTSSTTSDKPTVGARADGGKDHKPSVDRKARKAEEDQIEATYKADKAKCKDMKGNEKDACEADAKGKENVAKAELKAKYDPTPGNQRKVDEAKAEHQYKVAKEKCDAQKGKEESACEKQAKATHDKAKADIKAKYASNERRKSATGSTASTSK